MTGTPPMWCQQLAEKIYETWPRSNLPMHVWEEELTILDDLDSHAEGRAGTALRRLRRELRHPPTIAEFLEAYRSVQVNDASTREHCQACDSSGWVDHPCQLKTPQGTDYRSVTACSRCELGKRMARTQRRILAANAGGAHRDDD